ncbi:MAG: YIP1 family protein [Tannerellaceae bacterium]|jgi:hypothetical protein|nr:YIP1 family protein [Tannerellaceae bacterium]
MNTLLEVLFRSPTMAFGQLRKESKFPALILIVLLLVAAANLVIQLPITMKILRLTLLSLPENQMDMAFDVAYKLRYLQIFGSILGVAVILFLYAFLLYIITVIAKSSLTYIKSFTLILYSYFALLIGDLTNTGLLYVRGFDKIEHIYDISLTGLNLLTTLDNSGAAVYQFLSLINPFQIWFIILLSIGLRVFTDIKYIKALIICLIFWLITIIYPVSAAFFAETKLKDVMM